MVQVCAFPLPCPATKPGPEWSHCQAPAVSLPAPHPTPRPITTPDEHLAHGHGRRVGLHPVELTLSWQLHWLDGWLADRQYDGRCLKRYQRAENLSELERPA